MLKFTEFLREWMLNDPLYMIIILMMYSVGIWGLIYERKWFFALLTKTSAIDELVPNRITKIQGSIRIKQPLDFVDRQVALYRIVTRGRRAVYETDTIVEDERTVFDVVDRTGSLSIDPKDAEIDIKEPYLTEMKNTERTVYEFLEKDAEVFVLGRLSESPSGAKVFVKTALVPFLISDREQRNLNRLVASLLLKALCLMLLSATVGYFQYLEWVPAWQGTVRSKTETYGKGRMHYLNVMESDGVKSHTVNYDTWMNIQAGDIVQKQANDFEVRILR